MGDFLILFSLPTHHIWWLKMCHHFSFVQIYFHVFHKYFTPIPYWLNFLKYNFLWNSAKVFFASRNMIDLWRGGGRLSPWAWAEPASRVQPLRLVPARCADWTPRRCLGRAIRVGCGGRAAESLPWERLGVAAIGVTKWTIGVDSGTSVRDILTLAGVCQFCVSFSLTRTTRQGSGWYGMVLPFLPRYLCCPTFLSPLNFLWIFFFLLRWERSLKLTAVGLSV